MDIPDLSALGFKVVPVKEKPLTRGDKALHTIKYRAGLSVYKEQFLRGDAIGLTSDGKIGIVNSILKGYLNEPEGTPLVKTDRGAYLVKTKLPYMFTHEARGAHNMARILTVESSNDVLGFAGFKGRFGSAVVIRGPRRNAKTSDKDWQEAWNSLWACCVGLHPTIYAVVNTPRNGVKYIVQGGTSMNNLFLQDLSDVGTGFSSHLRDAIKKASSFGIIMCDIKPGNIVYMPDKTVMFIDLDPQFTLMAADELYATAECCEFVNILLLLNFLYCQLRINTPKLVSALSQGLVQNFSEITRMGIEGRQGQICAFLQQAVFRDAATEEDGLVDNLSAKSVKPEVIVKNVVLLAKHYMEKGVEDERVKACKMWDDENRNFIKYIKDHVVKEITTSLNVVTPPDDEL